MLDISKVEWEVMRVLWAREQVTSSEVIAYLKAKLAWSDSTVKTLLGRLLKKGVVSRRRQGRSFHYQAQVSEQDMIQGQLDSLLNRVCQKKQVALITYLLDKLALTPEDYENLQGTLVDKRKDLKERVVCTCSWGQCQCSGNCGGN